MPKPQTKKIHLGVSTQLAVQLLGVLVSLHGAYILADTLRVQVSGHHVGRLSDLVVDIPLMIGLSLVYLGALLRRRKRTAWLVTILAYAFYLGAAASELINHGHYYHHWLYDVLRLFVLPIVILCFLFYYQNEYFVKSDIRGFGFAARFSVIILLAAFIYGVTGFLLLDDSDFHQEIGLTQAAHYTLDQFNLTTNKPLTPYTKRAHLFDDSLSFVSVGAVAYAAISLFQPLRSRLVNQDNERERMRNLLNKYGGNSEEFFKLWPHDKQFFFDETGQSGLAFHVSRGIAICLGDPVGQPKAFKKLMRDFNNLCFGNDWLPAMVHIENKHRKIYEKYGFSLQKLGQEAVVEIDHFNKEVVKGKYFRQIRNKFIKRDYTYELLEPPHHDAVVERLKNISDEWLSQGNRAERGFVMGYFTPEYIQQCPVMVVRDAANTIQAFVNVIPASFEKDEATYDMLRQTNKSLGNINDFLLIGLIEHLQTIGFKYINLGLCPLVGLDEDYNAEQNRLINTFLSFAYANGDRFYSFQGLYKFKAKYEPHWRDRYVAYQGGLRGFARTISALMRSMRV
jgi:phosphatidylglycerol lysyltransferase